MAVDVPDGDRSATASSLRFEGTYTALVSPLTDGGERVDFEALEQLVEDQLAGGVSGLVACGTTGEIPTLSAAEQREVIARVVQSAAGRVPVVAGVGGNDTRKCIEASRAALEVGASGVMIVMPYYNKPSQDGMREHALSIAGAVKAPVILYNVPGRTVVDLGADATEQICAAADNIVAIKDATGNVLRCQELKRRLGDRLTVMSGDDGLTLGMMALGARGVISVTSNVLADKVSEVTRLMLAGDLAAARKAHFALLPFHELMFVEPNPVPAKTALSLLGKMSPAVRLPLLQAKESTCQRIAAALEEHGRKPG